MAHIVAGGGSRAALVDRCDERAALDRLLADVRAGHSGVLVLRGEAGIGKTALLDYLVDRSAGCRIARAIGVQAEAELPFAGLQQLCGPFLGHLDRLPAPQRAALGVAFGLTAGSAPDPFLVGLGVLGLLSDSADERASGRDRRRRPMARPRLGKDPGLRRSPAAGRGGRARVRGP